MVVLRRRKGRRGRRGDVGLGKCMVSKLVLGIS